MIDLYTWGTPNGRKVSIMLEATGLPYRTHPINILTGDQFKPEFLSISPNNKIPAITDESGPNGQPVELFESGAILLYLAEKTGHFIPSNPLKRIECLQWLMWQMGGFGPMLGQAHHFNRFAKEAVPYAQQRYHDEAHRLWGVLDKHLNGRTFMLDQAISIADFAIYPWTCRYEWQQIQLNEFPHVKTWMAQISSLEFVQRGMAVP